MVEISEIKDSDSLEAWLEDQPSEWSKVIAARCALRVLPLSWSFSLGEIPSESDLGILPVLRRTLASAVVGRNPTRDIGYEFKADANFAEFAFREVAKFGDPNGHREAFENGAASESANSALFARHNAIEAVKSAANAVTMTHMGNVLIIWLEVRADCTVLEKDGDVWATPLWSDGAPEGVDWHSLKTRIMSAENWQPGDWRFWVDWYEQMLDPATNPPNWELLEQVALIKPEVWDAGPKDVSEAIAALQDDGASETNLGERIAAQSLMRAALSDFSFDSAARLMRMVPFPEDVRFINDPDRLRSFLLDADDLRDEIEDYSAALKREGRAVQGAQFITGYLDNLLDEFSKARQTDQLNIGKIVRYGAFLDEARNSEETRKEFGTLLIKPLVNISDSLLDLTRRHLSETLMRFAPLDELTLEAGTTEWEYLNELRLLLTDLSKPSDRTPLDEKDQAVLNDLANAAERAMRAKSSITDSNALESVSREVNFRLAQLTVTLALFSVRRQSADGRTLANAEKIIDWLFRVKGLKELFDVLVKPSIM